MATTLDQSTPPDQSAADRVTPPDRATRDPADSAAPHPLRLEAQLVHLIAWLATTLWRATEFVPR
ncbi:MAG: hypothetical protein HY870_09285, partial [Chloroflexi bacterium]|nr:hypothetical protein [Chloroflexota bacterium]